MRVQILDVGGFVRDDLLGVPSKDRDCTVVIHDPPDGMTVEQGFEIMRKHLVDQGFVIFVETPENVTIRAHPPERGGLTADFVLARREGPYSDGRRPDWVELGSLADDLARRDFTVNAMARDLENGELIDHHNGRSDLDAKMLRFVGDPMQRLREDGLRAVRAIRFMVTKGFDLHGSAAEAICHPDVPGLVAAVSEERREQELRTMFDQADTMMVIDYLSALDPALGDALFSGRVRLTSTLKKQRGAGIGT